MQGEAGTWNGFIRQGLRGRTSGPQLYFSADALLTDPTQLRLGDALTYTEKWEEKWETWVATDLNRTTRTHEVLQQVAFGPRDKVKAAPKPPPFPPPGPKAQSYPPRRRAASASAEREPLQRRKAPSASAGGEGPAPPP